MRALLLQPDPAWLAERHRLGHDRFDEVWDGVLHVVPSPNSVHQRFEGALEAVLRPIALARGLEIFHNLDLLSPTKGADDYRQPDLAIVRPSDVITRGINGHAELVVEILSPDDESRDKFPFYARCQIPEYWIVDPESRAIEVYVLRSDMYELVPPNADGSIHAPRLDLMVQMIDGPKLRVSWPGGSADV